MPTAVAAASHLFSWGNKSVVVFSNLNDSSSHPDMDSLSFTRLRPHYSHTAPGLHKGR